MTRSESVLDYIYQQIQQRMVMIIGQNHDEEPESIDRL